MTIPLNDTRDVITAIALAHQIGFARGAKRDHDGLRDDLWLTRWSDMPWEEQMNEINAAAEALDLVAHNHDPEHFWEIHDWYLTIDEIAASILREVSEDDNQLDHDTLPWDQNRVRACLVKYEQEGEGEPEIKEG